jgi:CheY-like chemotaxis protein
MSNGIDAMTRWRHVMERMTIRMAGPIAPKQESRMTRILVAEDVDEMRTVIALELRLAGYAITECHNGVELAAALEGYLDDVPMGKAKRGFDLIIADHRMPGVFGLSVIEGTYPDGHLPPTILITAFGDDDTYERARKCGVAAVFDKPFPIDDLVDKVHDLVSR